VPQVAAVGLALEPNGSRRETRARFRLSVLGPAHRAPCVSLGSTYRLEDITNWRTTQDDSTISACLGFRQFCERGLNALGELFQFGIGAT